MSMSVLQDRLRQDRAVLLPGVFDALSALIAEKAGFEALFLSGSAVAYAQLGRPDIGLVTLSEMAAVCARAADRVAIPIIVDVDSGFGNAIHAARTIRVFEQAGASAIQIEDQAPLKPAQRPTDRPVIACAAMADKIKAATDARRSDAILVSARSDSPFTEPLDETLARVAAYRDAGADIIFVEGLTTAADVKAVIAEAQSLPVFYNLMRKTGDFSCAADLEAIGVSGVIFPGAAILPSAGAVQASMGRLREAGADTDPGDPMTVKDLNDLLELPALIDQFREFSE